MSRQLLSAHEVVIQLMRAFDVGQRAGNTSAIGHGRWYLYKYSEGLEATVMPSGKRIIHGRLGPKVPPKNAPTVITTVDPATHCSPEFAFAQCEFCHSVWQVGSRGRLPHCPDCGHEMCRIRHVKEMPSGTTKPNTPSRNDESKA